MFVFLAIKPNQIKPVCYSDLQTKSNKTVFFSILKLNQIYSINFFLSQTKPNEIWFSLGPKQSNTIPSTIFCQQIHIFRGVSDSTLWLDLASKQHKMHVCLFWLSFLYQKMQNWIYIQLPILISLHEVIYEQFMNFLGKIHIINILWG